MQKDYPLFTVITVAFLSMATVHLVGAMANMYIPAMHKPQLVECSITERYYNGTYVTKIGQGEIFY